MGRVIGLFPTPWDQPERGLDLPKGKATLEPLDGTKAGRPHPAWVPPSASLAQTRSPNNVCWML